MNRAMKTMLFILMVIYVFSPVDACPGPIDDIIVFLIYLASNKSIEAD